MTKILPGSSLEHDDCITSLCHLNFTQVLGHSIRRWGSLEPLGNVVAEVRLERTRKRKTQTTHSTVISVRKDNHWCFSFFTSQVLDAGWQTCGLFNSYQPNFLQKQKILEYVHISMLGCKGVESFWRIGCTSWMLSSLHSARAYAHTLKTKPHTKRTYKGQIIRSKFCDNIFVKKWIVFRN